MIFLITILFLMELLIMNKNNGKVKYILKIKVILKLIE